jgi:hypothetical protein
MFESENYTNSYIFSSYKYYYNMLIFIVISNNITMFVENKPPIDINIDKNLLIY